VLGMNTKIVFILWILSFGFLISNCENKSKEQVEESNKIDQIKEDKDLILGKWIFVDEEYDYEFWMYFDENKVYSDGMEEGADYKIENNAIISYPFGMESYTIIVSLTEEELILDTEGSIVTWTRAI
jgi:hypothetical protein